MCFFMLSKDIGARLLKKRYFLLVENDLYKYFTKLGWTSGLAFHVGAHKFEELNSYVSLGFSRVIWFDPISEFCPSSLPNGHTFHKILILNEESSIRFNYFSSATGYSSIYVPKRKRIMHSEVGAPSEQIIQSQRLSYWQEIIQSGFGTELPVTTLSISTQGSELEVLQSANLSLIDQIMVRTSANAIYEGAVDSKMQIESLLKSNGFSLNLDLSDALFKHGYQYFSKKNERYYFFASFTFKTLTLFHFLTSLVKRVQASILKRFKS
jgi:hypothetical protein